MKEKLFKLDCVSPSVPTSPPYSPIKVVMVKWSSCWARSQWPSVQSQRPAVERISFVRRPYHFMWAMLWGVWGGAQVYLLTISSVAIALPIQISLGRRGACGIVDIVYVRSLGHCASAQLPVPCPAAHLRIKKRKKNIRFPLHSLINKINLLKKSLPSKIHK